MPGVFKGQVLKEWTKEASDEFLDLLKNEPVLWNSKYRSKCSIYDSFCAWRRIQEDFSLPCTLNELYKRKFMIQKKYMSMHILVKKSAVWVHDGQIYKPGWFSCSTKDSFLGNACQGKALSNTKNIEKDEEEDIFDREIQEDSAPSSLQKSAYFNSNSIADGAIPLVEAPNNSNNELQHTDVITEGQDAGTIPSFNFKCESVSEEQNNHGNDDSHTKKKSKRHHNDSSSNSAVESVPDRHSMLKMALGAISRNSDDSQTFGNFVASSLRNLKSDANRRKLRLAIQRIILDISTSDDLDN